MSESVPVRCPVCRREHRYTAQTYPCGCGTPVTPPLNRLAPPAAVTHPTWDDLWVEVRCTVCGCAEQWPQPELDCPCGTILRLPVHGVSRPSAPAAPDTSPGAGAPSGDETGGGTPDGGDDPKPRTPFQPMTIPATRDAVTAAALYLRRLGYRGIRRADRQLPNGTRLAAPGILAQVNPAPRPAAPRDVECLWLTALSESARCAYFSLAGYTDEARSVADRLGVPLFVLDLTGTPHPVNSPADDLSAGRA